MIVLVVECLLTILETESDHLNPLLWPQLLSSEQEGDGMVYVFYSAVNGR